VNDGSNPKAILLGGGAIAVSVARSLGRATIPVIALGDAGWDLVAQSRYCRTFVDLGSGEGVQERWLEWLLSQRSERAVILPCNDDGLELVARKREVLVEHGYQSMEANEQAVLAMLNKNRTYELAREAGVDAPRTATVQGIETVDAALERIGMTFPCALKPLHSHLFARHYGLSQKVFIVRNREELDTVLADVSRHHLEMLLTEIIPGRDDAHVSFWTYLDEGGQPLFRFTKRKLRQYPSEFGLGCYHVTEWNPFVAEIGLRFCKQVGIRGIAIVEFKRDQRDGRFKLIECNARFPLAIEILRCAGIDLSLLAYNRVLKRSTPTPGAARTGIYLWFPIEDVRALAEYRRRGEISVTGWCASVWHRQHFPIWSFADPGPAIASYRRLFRGALVRASRWARARRGVF
jgi:predicted ATP-grasp superfamily ATP-dependent carboligase